MKPWQPVLVQHAGPQLRGTELALKGGERRLRGGALLEPATPTKGTMAFGCGTSAPSARRGRGGNYWSWSD
jgi:hypothetical protein